MKKMKKKMKKICLCSSLVFGLALVILLGIGRAKTGYMANSRSVMTPDVKPLLSTLDGVELNEHFEWEPWIRTQMQRGSEALLDGGKANPERVKEFVEAFGCSAKSDVCWMFSWDEGLFPNSYSTPSLNVPVESHPRCMEWALVYEARNTVLITEINARLLNDKQFRKAYFRMAFWLGGYAGYGTAYRDDANSYLVHCFKQLAEMSAPNFEPVHAYRYARFWRWFVFLMYLTDQEEYIERLRDEPLAKVVSDWKEKRYTETMDHLLECPHLLTPCNWPYGCGPDMKGPATPVAGISLPKSKRVLECQEQASSESLYADPTGCFSDK